MYKSVKYYEIKTGSSIWKFDILRKKYLRNSLPNSYPPGAMTLPYSPGWDDFVSICEDYILLSSIHTPTNRIVVVRPIPFGQGQIRVTGPVVSGKEELLTAYKKVWG